MKTDIIQLDKANMDRDKLTYAAQVIREGGLVAFPTETVYGLGANALNPEAVANIFKAKGRPSDNPLIVHIAQRKEVEELTSEIPEQAFKLMDHFWPGPLTMVMKKSSHVPDLITAGLDTVAIRMPAHPVALALIEMSGVPVAAPSANVSGRPSPTTAKHVIEDLEGKVDIILDAGFSNVGLESTVIDLTVDPAMVLRPGGVTVEQLEQVLGRVSIDPSLTNAGSEKSAPKSPGMKYTHYAPKADVMIVQGAAQKVIKKINELIGEYGARGMKVGVLATQESKEHYVNAQVLVAGSRLEPGTIAANLFWTLREFDHRGVDLILAEAIEDTGIGFAVMNRMSKAAGYNIIKVE